MDRETAMRLWRDVCGSEEIAGLPPTGRLLEKFASRVAEHGADWLAFADELEAFQPRGELGPLYGAGMAFAYSDVAKTIRAKVATSR